MSQVMAGVEVMADEKSKRINLHVTDRTLENDRIVGEFIDEKMGGFMTNLRHDSNPTGFNRGNLVAFVARNFRNMLEADEDKRKRVKYNFEVLAVKDVERAARMYQQMIRVDRDSSITSIFVDPAARENLEFLWGFFMAYQMKMGIEIRDLKAPQGDHRNLRMVIWMIMELAARMIEKGKWEIKL